MERYVLGIDQSTQGTKALLFNGHGELVCRTDLPHRQIINEKGWVEHDPEEIWANTLQVVRDLVEKAGIDRAQLAALGISNQRETAVVWDKQTGKPVYNAIVWQCARAVDITDEIEQQGLAETVRGKTGLQLSPYFSAAKFAWIFRHTEGVREAAAAGKIAVGTVDSWLVWNLTHGARHQTDYSNAARTQLFNIHTLDWDEELLSLFGIDRSCMAQVTDSDGDFGSTDFDGYLDAPIPICGVLGDSNGALFGQGCHAPGMTKTTYGTGSSIMMNIGTEPVLSDRGVVTSIAWSRGGRTEYVMEGNINYSAAVVTWLKDDMKLIDSPAETEACARAAHPGDTTYLVPAFSGLGAPYWDSKATAVLCGMTRMTGRNEVIRAALDCIAYQIAAVVKAMEESAGVTIGELRADGGPTRNAYLMQFQSDLLGIPVRVPNAEELSGIGAAYMAGLSAGIYTDEVFGVLHSTAHEPSMPEDVRQQKYRGWEDAVRLVLGK